MNFLRYVVLSVLVGVGQWLRDIPDALREYTLAIVKPDLPTPLVRRITLATLLVAAMGLTVVAWNFQVPFGFNPHWLFAAMGLSVVWGLFHAEWDLRVYRASRFTFWFPMVCTAIAMTAAYVGFLAPDATPAIGHALIPWVHPNAALGILGVALIGLFAASDISLWDRRARWERAASSHPRARLFQRWKKFQARVADPTCDPLG